MCSQGELLIGREDDQVVSGERRLWIEAQQGVEHAERPLGHAESWPRDADGAEHLPLVDDLVRRSVRSDELRGHMGKRQRSPPEGRRWLMCLHVFAQSGKENLLTGTARLSDSDSRKWEFSGCEAREGLPGRRRFGGLFPLPACSLLSLSRGG